MHAPRPGHRGARRFLVFLLAVFVLAPSALWATRVRPVNLEELTAHAAVIFSGRCVEIEHVVSDGYRGVQVTFEVDRAVKGARGDRLTIRLPGEGLVGLPRFEPGEQVVLFLYGESASGWSSPVGLGQGKFTVFEDKLGQRRALNALGNAPLFDHLSARARQRLEAAGQATGEGAEKGIPQGRLLDLVESLLEPGP
jgi:hypothetical protein